MAEAKKDPDPPKENHLDTTLSPLLGIWSKFLLDNVRLIFSRRPQFIEGTKMPTGWTMQEFISKTYYSFKRFNTKYTYTVTVTVGGKTTITEKSVAGGWILPKKQPPSDNPGSTDQFFGANSRFIESVYLEKNRVVVIEECDNVLINTAKLLTLGCHPEIA